MKKLSWTQRIALAEGIKAGKSNAQIARELGVHRSTVGREIARNADSRESYAPQEADLKSWRRQQEAMPRRFIVTFCGVEFLSTLTKRNRIYTYISRTHLNSLCRPQEGTPNTWESTYVQIPKQRFTPDLAFARFQTKPLPGLVIPFSNLQSSASSPDPLFNRPSFSPRYVSAQGLLKRLSSPTSGRMSFFSRFKPVNNRFTKPVSYKTISSGYASFNPCQSEIFIGYSFICRKNHTSFDVRFLPEMKNSAQKMTFYIIKQDQPAVKVL